MCTWRSVDRRRGKGRAWRVVYVSEYMQDHVSWRGPGHDTNNNDKPYDMATLYTCGLGPYTSAQPPCGGRKKDKKKVTRRRTHVRAPFHSLISQWSCQPESGTHTPLLSGLGRPYIQSSLPTGSFLTFSRRVSTRWSIGMILPSF